MRGLSVADSLIFEWPDGSRVRVRLYGIDAPEKDQPFALDARKKLSYLTYDKPIRVKVTEIDQYGRYVGRVYAGARYVNRFMLKEGMAWHYRYYAAGDAVLAEAESGARAAKRGIWGSDSPLRPRNFRSEQRKEHE